MNPDRLTGFVYPVKKNGVPVPAAERLGAALAEAHVAHVQAGGTPRFHGVCAEHVLDL
jgi:hypothetical protein